jgi:hypothetical protein
MIEITLGKQLIGHISRHSTARKAAYCSTVIRKAMQAAGRVP